MRNRTDITGGDPANLLIIGRLDDDPEIIAWNKMVRLPQVILHVDHEAALTAQNTLLQPLSLSLNKTTSAFLQRHILRDRRRGTVTGR